MYQAVSGFNHGPNDERVDEGATLPDDFAPEKTIRNLLRNGAIVRLPDVAVSSGPETGPALTSTPGDDSEASTGREEGDDE